VRHRRMHSATRCHIVSHGRMVKWSNGRCSLQGEGGRGLTPTLPRAQTRRYQQQRHLHGRAHGKWRDAGALR
jgi:hypothetical protein